MGANGLREREGAIPIATAAGVAAGVAIVATEVVTAGTAVAATTAATGALAAGATTAGVMAAGTVATGASAAGAAAGGIVTLAALPIALPVILGATAVVGFGALVGLVIANRPRQE